MGGDVRYGIQTFASRVGVGRVARGAVLMLMLNYVGAIVTGIINPMGAFNARLMVLGHALLGGELLRRYRKLDATSLRSIKTFYAGIWDLFYLEYALYCLI